MSMTTIIYNFYKLYQELKIMAFYYFFFFLSAVAPGPYFKKKITHDLIIYSSLRLFIFSSILFLLAFHTQAFVPYPYFPLSIFLQWPSLSYIYTFFTHIVTLLLVSFSVKQIMLLKCYRLIFYARRCNNNLSTHYIDINIIIITIIMSPRRISFT